MREIAARGHDVRLIPPAYVKPFVKRGKTDAADAEAISEAVIRKTMRFVPIKSIEQQTAALVLKTRGLLVRQKTLAINALRAHLSELGVVVGIGTAKVAGLIEIDVTKRIIVYRRPPALPCRQLLIRSRRWHGRSGNFEGQIVAEAKRDEDMRWLATIPGVGAITAPSIKALVPDPAGFKSLHG